MHESKSNGGKVQKGKEIDAGEEEFSKIFLMYKGGKDALLEEGSGSKFPRSKGAGKSSL